MEAKKRYRKVIRDSIRGITKPSIRRLIYVGAAKGGFVASRIPKKASTKGLILGIDGIVYEETRGLMKVLLEQVIRQSYILATESGRKKLTSRDVQYAIDTLGGKKIYDTDSKDVCRVKVSFRNMSQKDIRELNSGVFLIPRAAFSRLVKEIAQDDESQRHTSPIITVDAMNAIQTYIEDSFITFFQSACAAAIAAGRHRLQTKDMQFIRRVAFNMCPSNPFAWGWERLNDDDDEL